jgi:hypothetical protein
VYLDQELPLYKVDRVVAKASYKGLPIRDYIESDVKAQDEVNELEFVALEWLKNGHNNISIDLNIHAALKVDPAAGAPPSTQPRTQTLRQLAALDTAKDACVESGDYSGRIREWWSCSQKDCKNHNAGSHGGYCYWQRSDTAHNHYPLNREVLAEWSKGIKEKGGSHKEPPNSVWPMLVDARETLRNRSHRRQERPALDPAAQFATTGSSNMPSINVFCGYGGPSGYPPPYPPPARPQSSPEPQSSQPTITPSSELFERFIEWAKNEVDWKEDSVILDAIKETLQTERYDFEGARTIDRSDWLELGFARGLYKKWNKSTKKWWNLR